MAVREALVVATSSYKDTRLNQLNSPGLDAMSLSEVLSDPGIGDYAVRPLIDQPAHVVQQEIERFFKRRKPDDQLLLYMSCHGIKDSTLQLYFAAANTNRDLLDSTSVPAVFLNGQLIRCASRKILVLLDCCYSGAFKPGGTKSADTEVHLLEEFKDTGVAVITATDALQQAWEGDGPVTDTGEGQLSVFTAAAVEGLRSGRADRDGDGWVSVEDLYGYVREEMLARDARQNPLRWILGGQGTLKVARRADAGSAPLPLPRPLPTLGSPAVEILGAVSAAAAALRRTLGPIPRKVLLTGPDGTPYGSTDTREIVAALPTGIGHAAIGTGLVRDLVADQYARTQDGTATAVVLFEAVLRGLQPALARGAHPTVLVRVVSVVLEKARAILFNLVRDWTTTAQDLVLAMQARVSDSWILKTVLEALTGTGTGFGCPDGGYIAIAPSAGRDITCHISEGCILGSAHLSRHLVPDEVTGQSVLREAHVLLCAERVSSAADARAAGSLATLGGRPLLVVAAGFGEDALDAFAAHTPEIGPICVPVPLPDSVPYCPGSDPYWLALQPGIVSLFTGARVFQQAQGIRTATPQDLGTARRAVVAPHLTALVGGGGDADLHAAHIERLKIEHREASRYTVLSPHLLAGRVAEIAVGGTDETATRRSISQVQQALRVGIAAQQRGILPGGAAALAVAGHRLGATVGLPEHEATTALLRALDQPLFALAENHGAQDPGALIARIHRDWPDATYDAEDGITTTPVLAYSWIPTVDVLAIVRSVEASVLTYLSLI
ncbi:TCP-1/cpn60 chaperonin family protein [Streptomyces sp. NPDC091371]|uniref:caspase, EACC1-associated type n=1 Tax=Streptomyces sp. NPDC091371 TaxID=3155303 RepID=UPI0034424DEA